MVASRISILGGLRSFSFCLPRNLSNHVDRLARTGDIVLVKSREMTGKSQTLLCWSGVGGVKTTETNYIGPVGLCGGGSVLHVMGIADNTSPVTSHVLAGSSCWSKQHRWDSSWHRYHIK